MKAAYSSRTIKRPGVAGERAEPAPRSLFATGGRVALAMMALAWLGLIVGILRHAIFVTNDSLSDYAHVWYVSRQLWQHGRIPVHMPIIGHGQAYAFPYSFLPWMSAALLRPLLGDWVVTLWLVLGALGCIGASFWAFPELRRGWWGAAMLANPPLLAGPLLGQLPFLWAAALLLAAIGCWRRGLLWPAVILAGLAQATHAAVVLPLAGLLVLGRLRREPRPRQLVAGYALSLLIALPAVYFVLASPVTSDSGFGTVVVNFVETLASRAGIVVFPLVLLALRRYRPRLAPAAFVGLLALTLSVASMLQIPSGVLALGVSPDTNLLGFIDSPAFQPGSTYRILRVGDGKVGMYQLIQHGAKLDSEFFPESIHRSSFPSADTYAAFLQARGVDDVLIYRNYDDRYLTNEHELLDALEAAPHDGVWAERIVQTPDYDVYSIHRDSQGFLIPRPLLARSPRGEGVTN